MTLPFIYVMAGWDFKILATVLSSPLRAEERSANLVGCARAAGPRAATGLRVHKSHAPTEGFSCHNELDRSVCNRETSASERCLDGLAKHHPPTEGSICHCELDAFSGRTVAEHNKPTESWWNQPKFKLASPDSVLSPTPDMSSARAASVTLLCRCWHILLASHVPTDGKHISGALSSADKIGKRSSCVSNTSSGFLLQALMPSQEPTDGKDLHWTGARKFSARSSSQTRLRRFCLTATSC